MKKYIFITIIFFFLFLSVAFSVNAEIFAGASAILNHNSFIESTEIEYLRQKNTQVIIENVLNKYNSPMANESKSFVKACIKYQINCYLLPSIAGLESTFGKFIWPNSYNAFGWARGYMMFESWADGIDTVAKGLRKNYFNKGALTVEDIGPIYSESPTWAVRVNYFIHQFEKEEEKMLLLSNQFPVQL
ncbi:hypothetical protein COS77_01375 [Candidatus Roizmanbacteria bacterium CG06_land_8_20_14_3_00_34_14]|uniref:Mannosyl-glycoprotein endo-beta-N-acetylglucosamidase-like domain-containing protein n=2 Tax=Candidatus Roizmaniibacteriota TaxID=1752723 RepID=A0A2M7AV48_9BACT|nr:MAG: hypothetical protein COT02_03725 [Candidatus Roizmanbacteria bacterium CG07_land_8_20_14_0_80_34_15]PIU74466.1 MAG: hypothetical protein COS77_01375 [Candidatus Roizmanbacteria bacterium CG06_land_8_20_14_3_00_34_14]